MKKVLYFEGAGSSYCGAKEGWTDIANCRIRTAFTNNQGKNIYLEILGRQISKDDVKIRGMKQPVGAAVGFIDFAHYITDDPDTDDCNNSKVYYSAGKPVERTEFIEYTKEGIKNFINNIFDCSFDEVECLNELTGYRVFSDKEAARGTSGYYNFGDVFPYDPERTARRCAKRDELSEYFKQFMKYDNTSYWVDENGNMVVKINTNQNDFEKMKFKERQFVVKVK